MVWILKIIYQNKGGGKDDVRQLVLKQNKFNISEIGELKKQEWEAVDIVKLSKQRRYSIPEIG